MEYLDLIVIVFVSIWLSMTIMFFHFVVFAMLGIFAKKTYPKTDECLKYGVIISARNEEMVISGLINSLRLSDYPQEKLDIFVLAHNCTDNTADVCRRLNVNLYEYNNPNERTVGYAYRYLFQKIQEDYDTESYDGFLILDADNVVTTNYIQKLNDAFVACGKKHVITSFRNSKNFSQNYMSCLYGIFFAMACRFEARGRTLCNCSTRVSGTGYLLPTEAVKNGWNYVTLTEDWEFSADQITQGRKIYYCDEAEFYDEQPTAIKIMLRQRLRWGKGHMDVFFTRFKQLLSSLFGRGAKERKKLGGKNTFSIYDITLQIMPLGVIGVSLSLIQFALVASLLFFGYSTAVLFNCLLWFAISIGCGYAITVLTAVLLFLLERKRLGKVRFFTLLLACLLWPTFLLVSVFQDIAVLFIRKLEWKPIPHSHNMKAMSILAVSEEKPVDCLVDTNKERS